MLTTLRIKNLALVPDLTLELQPGYNVVTGETGAGKSILIGALNLVLGERADRTVIRSGCDSGSVEARFEVSQLRAPLSSFLEENGLEPCEAHQLVLKRTFSAAGANRQFVNGTPTTLNTLAALGEWLVDIHGPHEHQSLLHPAKQLAILDAFGKLNEPREQFAQLLRCRSTLEADKAALIVDEKTYAQQLDLLRFQVQEISAAQLQPDEEQTLDQEYQRASHAAQLLELSQSALALLDNDDHSLLTQAGAVGRALQELQHIDATAAPLASLHEQIAGLLRDLQTELSRYADRVEVDPARLQQLEERLNLIHALKRKYGANLAEVIAFGEAARQKLSLLEQRDAELERINGQIKTLEADLGRAGRELSAQRRKVIPKLCKAVGKQLSDLGFQQSHFEVALSSASEISNLKSQIPRPAASPISNLQSPVPRPSASEISNLKPQISLSGLDTIEFQFAPNPGEPPRPLRAIASSGEMARVMLALKTVLAAEDDIPLLVFDEVDANIGGETAQAVGEKMRQIGRKRQVLCITHLAPVAACASAHFVVTKAIKEGRTISDIRLLEQTGRVPELARMLGSQSEAARRHAEALLQANLTLP